MKNGTRWVVVDTETDGLYEPIHIVELSAQLMEGWDPVGDPFRMLLNHNVHIPSAAVAIHGYTQEYLAQYGEDPTQVHCAFRDYAQNYPVVAHNLSFDWNRCLQPEWARLGLPPAGQRGFCCMMLARRLLAEVTSYRLNILKQQFHLKESRSHQATNDVLTVVELFQNIYRPRLEPVGLNTFESVAAFSKRTPVAKCLDLVRTGSISKPPAQPPEDEWYFIDAANNSHGPLPAFETNKSANLQVYYIWRTGMPDWTKNLECPEFLSLLSSPQIVESSGQTPASSKTMSELIGVCRGIIADNRVTTAEVMFLNSWLQDFGPISEWPASEISHAVERILEDGIVTKQEKDSLKSLLERITDPNPTASQPQPQTPPVGILLTPIEPIKPYTVVRLDQGTPEWREWRGNGIGASDASTIMGENPFKNRRQLLWEKSNPTAATHVNAAMARGTQLEPEARVRYASYTGREVRPACLLSLQYDWLRASVDGISPDEQTVVEIKCGESAYRKTSETKRPPHYYYAQLQHILAVTGLASIDFWCYLPGCGGILINVPRDEAYIERLVAAELAFWAELKATL